MYSLPKSKLTQFFQPPLCATISATTEQIQIRHWYSVLVISDLQWESSPTRPKYPSPLPFDPYLSMQLSHPSFLSGDEICLWDDAVDFMVCRVSGRLVVADRHFMSVRLGVLPSQPNVVDPCGLCPKVPWYVNGQVINVGETGNLSWVFQLSQWISIETEGLFRFSACVIKRHLGYVLVQSHFSRMRFIVFTGDDYPFQLDTSSERDVEQELFISITLNKLQREVRDRFQRINERKSLSHSSYLKVNSGPSSH